MISQLYEGALFNLSAGGEEPVAGFIYPWVHRNRFVRVPVYDDGYLAFGGSTAMVGKSCIRVRNAYGDRRKFPLSEISAAAVFLVEV